MYSCSSTAPVSLACHCDLSALSLSLSAPCAALAHTPRLTLSSDNSGSGAARARRARRRGGAATAGAVAAPSVPERRLRGVRVRRGGKRGGAGTRGGGGEQASDPCAVRRPARGRRVTGQGSSPHPTRRSNDFDACAGATGRSVVRRGGAGRGPGARRRPRRRLGAPHGRGEPLSGSRRFACGTVGRWGGLTLPQRTSLAVNSKTGQYFFLS